jgi:branched-chain amino acid transport system substrate-binding protein
MHATFKRSLAAISLALGACATLVPAAQAANEQFFPLATYRVGAYASSGIPVWAGMIDYLRYIRWKAGSTA